jgi:hypothetical protein
MSLNPLQIRKRLGRDDWSPPREFGEHGWVFDNAHFPERGRIIVTCSEFTLLGEPAGLEYVHASWSWQTREPNYGELVHLHKAVWPEGYAYQVFAPPSDHVNIHMYALHLWGRLDGKPILPEFGKFGTI